MTVAIDVVLALLGLIVLIKHTVNGFIRSIFGLLKLAASVALSWVLTPILFPDGEFTTRLICYVLCFVAAYIVLTVLGLLLDRLFQLPVLNAANKLLGFILGVVCMYIVLSAAAGLLTIIFNLADGGLFDMTGAELEKQTYIYSFFSQNGIFTLIDKLTD